MEGEFDEGSLQASDFRNCQRCGADGSPSLCHCSGGRHGFTSGAACNPTLTIVALAIRQADSIARMMEQREI